MVIVAANANDVQYYWKKTDQNCEPSRSRNFTCQSLKRRVFSMSFFYLTSFGCRPHWGVGATGMAAKFPSCWLAEVHQEEC